MSEAAFPADVADPGGPDRGNRTATIEAHARTRQIELGRAIAGRRKIYLDACFWIILRDTELGLRTGSAERKLLHLLRRGVGRGALICPIGAHMFIELMKQPDTPGRRPATARLIDELSLGVSAIDPRRRLGTEVHRFMLGAIRGEEAVHPMQELIWTKAAYVLGDTYPMLNRVPRDVEQAIQRRFFDHLWDTPLSALIDTIGDGPGAGVAGKADFKDLTRETNEQNRLHRDELTNLAKACDIELRGAIEIAGEIAADVIAELERRETGRRPVRSAAQRADSVNQCRNLLYLAMRRPEARLSLRTLHVASTIHGRMRWNKERKFKPNDWHDFGHAELALTYCDAFLTEWPLHDLVTRPEPSLEGVNGCRVVSDVEAAVGIVHEALRVAHSR